MTNWRVIWTLEVDSEPDLRQDGEEDLWVEDVQRCMALGGGYSGGSRDTKAAGVTPHPWVYSLV